MKINSRTSGRTRVSFRGWAVWAASIVIILGVDRPPTVEDAGSEVVEGEAKEVSDEDGQALVPR